MNDPVKLATWNRARMNSLLGPDQPPKPFEIKPLDFTEIVDVLKVELDSRYKSDIEEATLKQDEGSDFNKVALSD